jgi:hypothetical protein
MHSDDGRRFLLREATDGQARAEVLDLLEAAGWSRPLLESWAAVGMVVELYDPADDDPCGAAIIDATGEGSFALRAWTVDTDGPAAWPGSSTPSPTHCAATVGAAPLPSSGTPTRSI